MSCVQERVDFIQTLDEIGDGSGKERGGEG